MEDVDLQTVQHNLLATMRATRNSAHNVADGLDALAGMARTRTVVISSDMADLMNMAARLLRMRLANPDEEPKAPSTN